MVKIPDNTIYDLEMSAQAPLSIDPTANKVINPNSGCRAFYQFGEFSFELYAVVRVIFDLIKEPCFSTLRTKEQLGYIVQTVPNKMSRVIVGFIQVQSSKYSPDYLEWRINNVLQTIKAEGGFSNERVENVKAALIKGYEQVHLSIHAETADFWSSMAEDNFAFDRNKRMIEALGKVTT